MEALVSLKSILYALPVGKKFFAEVILFLMVAAAVMKYRRLEPAQAEYVLLWGRIIMVWSIAVLALPFITFSIAINANRTVQLAKAEALAQQGYVQLAKIRYDIAPIKCQNDLDKSDDRRGIDSLDIICLLKRDIRIGSGSAESLRGEIAYGMNVYWDYSRRHCIIFPGPKCFHKNSSEHNNIILAVASGIIGSILAIASAAVPNGSVRSPDELFAVRRAMFRVLTGASVGLLTLLLMRGVRGATLTSLSSAIDVNDPYSVALLCTLAGMFSREMMTALKKLLDALLDKLPSPKNQSKDGDKERGEGAAQGGAGAAQSQAGQEPAGAAGKVR